MNTPIEIPLWLLLLMAAGCGYALLIAVLVPGVRWIVRRRLNQAIARINRELRIQVRPFQHARRHALIERLAYDAEIAGHIEQISEESGESREVLQARVYRFAREIAPAFNAYLYFRVGLMIARRVSRFLYRVRVGAADADRLAEVDPGATVVFAMNHRSNIDYLLVSYLVADQVSLSYAVGEWARIFPLQSLIRAMGAFFVRRNSEDPLYRKVLERYVAIAASEGVAQAVYIEGGLSRDGSMGRPRLGFLDYLLRNFDDRGERDLIFVPVAINYDHVLEDENMLSWASESAARRNKREHLLSFLRFLRGNLFVGVRERWRRFGYASVNFGLPLSMRTYCAQRGVHFHQLERDARFAEVGRLADEIVGKIQHVMPVLPVPLICMVFLEAGDESLQSLDIFARVDGLIDRIIARGSAMRAVEKPRDRTLTESIEMLKGRAILLADADRIRVNPSKEELVRYYARSIAHWFS